LKKDNTNKVLKEKKVILEGIVTTVHPGMQYTVEVDYKGFKHNIVCYVAGDLTSHYIEIRKGDQVRVEISLYDIDHGRIVYRLTERKFQKQA
jgi:translation initiation factor IF-1